MGLARRAGHVLMGQTLVEESIDRHKASFVIVATDLSVRTKQQIVARCQAENIPYYEGGTKQELSQAIGKQNYGIFAVTKKQCSKKLMNLLETGGSNESA